MAGEPTTWLPNVDRAIVEERRIHEYLLNALHRSDRSKANFFLARQFDTEHWQDFRDALIVRA